VCNALAPAEISRVIIDEENRSMEVIVPDEFLSIAIGKNGQNVRLASKLTKWHIDVISEERYSEAMQSGYDSLVALTGMTISMADALYEKGYFSAEELSNAAPEDLIQIRDIDTTEKAEKLIETAKDYVANIKEVGTTSEEELSDDSDEPANQKGAETSSLSDDQKDSGEEASSEENVPEKD